jgi:predicted nucleic acid-binding Zn ribbon protein
MYCLACGTQLAPGLSFCNRCGMSLKERAGSNAAPIAAFLFAITIIGVAGLGIMLGGTLVLTKEAHLKEELLGFFMLFTFFIVAIIEILLFRQLSRFSAAGKTKAIEAAQPLPTPVELRASQTPRTLVEPMPSVTENTTRTLQYSPNEPAR